MNRAMARWRGPMLLFGLGAFAAYFIVAGSMGFESLIGALSQMQAQTLAAVLSLSLFNYVIRFVRWHGLLGRLGCQVPMRLHFLYYLAGFALTLTPAKAGEALRGWYLSRHGVAYAQTLAALLVERVLDLLAILLLAMLWLTRDPRLLWTALAMSGVILGFVAALRLPWIRSRLARLSGHGRSGQFADFVLRLTQDAHDLLHLRRLLPGLMLGLLAWGAEGYGLYLLGQQLDIPMDTLTAIGIYAAATLVGALSFLPGGLGGADLSMGGLLLLTGAPAAAALSATMICRLATLWFAIAIGAAVVAWLEWRQPHLDEVPVP
jgi:uncharacterized protein (TIRG00374 family)